MKDSLFSGGSSGLFGTESKFKFDMGEGTGGNSLFDIGKENEKKKEPFSKPFGFEGLNAFANTSQSPFETSHFEPSNLFTNAKESKANVNSDHQNNSLFEKENSKETPSLIINSSKEIEKAAPPNPFKAKPKTVEEAKQKVLKSIQEQPISQAKLISNAPDEDLLNDAVYCSRISKMLNEWKQDLDGKYTFYASYRKRLISNSFQLGCLKESANTTSSLFNTIQGHVRESLGALTTISKQQKDLIEQLKQFDANLNQYDVFDKGNDTPMSKEAIKILHSQLIATQDSTTAKIEAIQKHSSHLINPSKQLKPITAQATEALQQEKHSPEKLLKEIYKEIQSIQQLEQAMAIKCFST